MTRLVLWLMVMSMGIGGFASVGFSLTPEECSSKAYRDTQELLSRRLKFANSQKENWDKIRQDLQSKQNRRRSLKSRMFGGRVADVKDDFVWQGSTLLWQVADEKEMGRRIAKITSIIRNLDARHVKITEDRQKAQELEGTSQEALQNEASLHLLAHADESYFLSMVMSKNEKDCAWAKTRVPPQTQHGAKESSTVGAKRLNEDRQGSELGEAAPRAAKSAR